MKNRIMAMLLAAVMLITFALPVSASQVRQIQLAEDIFETPDDFDGGLPGSDDLPEYEGFPEEELPEQEYAGSYPADADTEQSADEAGEQTEQPDASVFVLDLPPDVEAQFIAWLEAAQRAVENPALIAPFALSGDTGTVTWVWGEQVNFQTTAGHFINNVPRITLNTANMPIGTPVCTQFGIDPNPNATYTAQQGGNQVILRLLIALHEGRASFVGVQFAIWSITNHSSFAAHPEAQAAIAAAGSSNTSGFSYLLWTTANGQPFVTLIEEYDNGNGNGYGDDEKEFRVEWYIETITETSFNQTQTFSYSRAYGQVLIRKQNQNHDPLSGAVFRIQVDFACGGPSVINESFVVDDGARLFTYQHPQGTAGVRPQPARITVTEVSPPRHYTLASNPTQIVYVEPSYTRWTHIVHYEYTVNTTTYWWVVIEIRNGEESVVDRVQAGSPIVTMSPRTQINSEDHAAPNIGERNRDLLFINERQRGQIVVTKRDAHNGQPLAGAQIRVTGRDLGNAGTFDQILTTGSDGRAVFSGLFPGSYEVREERPPHAFNLDDQPVQTAVLQSNESVYLEFHNTRRSGLFVRKVDQDGNALPGAVFEIRRGSGQVLMREVTDQNGLIFMDYLVTGYLVIEELSAPTGFLLDENPVQTIFIDNDDPNNVFTVTFVNRRKPSIEVIKIDADNPTVRLEGAVFRVTDTRTGNYWDITTGPDGVARLENLDIDTTFMVEERQAPAGFVRSNYRHEIVLRESRVHTVVVGNSRSPALRIIKICEETGDPLEGVVFRVAPRGGMEYRDVATGSDGSVTVTNLAPGWHVITEQHTVGTHLLSLEPFHIEVVAGETAEMIVTNQRRPSLTILKTCSVTGQPLVGARFRVSEMEGRTLGEFTSDEYGRIYLPNLEPSMLKIEELRAPDGYLILDGSMEILLVPGVDRVVEFVNHPINPLIIKKICANTGDALADAVFRVTDINGAFIGEFRTGRYGFATVTGIEPGTWASIFEIRAPMGFVLNSSPQHVQVRLEAPTIVEFENIPKSGLLIRKGGATRSQLKRLSVEPKISRLKGTA